MVNREMKKVYKRVFTSGKDAYGQIRQLGSTDHPIEMAVHIYNQTEKQNIIYNEVELIGLTKANVTDANQIVIDGTAYNILHTIPGKYTQVLMRR